MHSWNLPRNKTSPDFSGGELFLPAQFPKQQHQYAAQTVRLHLLSQNITPTSFTPKEC